MPLDTSGRLKISAKRIDDEILPACDGKLAKDDLLRMLPGEDAVDDETDD